MNDRGPPSHLGAWRFHAAAVLLCAAALGCSEPRTVKVIGRVTRDGKPVANASVVFISDYADHLPASGVTDADGRYSLRTYLKADEVLEGAFPDDYGIVIYKFKRPLPERVDAELARRSGWPMPPMADESEVPVDELPTGDALARDFKAPTRAQLASGRDLSSIRDILSLSDDDLRQLSDYDLKTLRMPPPWSLFGNQKEAWELAEIRARGRALLPMRYADRNTSGFHAELQRGGDEPVVMDFDLSE